MFNVAKIADTVTTQLNQVTAWLERISGQMTRMIKLLEEVNARLAEQSRTDVENPR